MFKSCEISVTSCKVRDLSTLSHLVTTDNISRTSIRKDREGTFLIGPVVRYRWGKSLASCGMQENPRLWYRCQQRYMTGASFLMTKMSGGDSRAVLQTLAFTEFPQGCLWEIKCRSEWNACNENIEADFMKYAWEWKLHMGERIWIFTCSSWIGVQ